MTWFDDNFLNTIPKAWSLKERIDKLKIKIFMFSLYRFSLNKIIHTCDFISQFYVWTKKDIFNRDFTLELQSLIY